MKNNFRASWSVLNTWASGNWERAIKGYFKLENFTTPAMAEGKKYHQEWADYIIKNNKLPDIFGGVEVKNPIVERKSKVKVNDWLDLVYIIDEYDNETIRDWKTGKQGSNEYASSMQIPLYAVGATLDGLLVKKGEVYRYDQYLKKVDMSILWVTDKVLEDAHNWLITLAGDMQNYLLKNNLYERFSGSRKWD